MKPWFYPDEVSAAPGGRVTIHASADASPATLVVRRIGAESREVARFDGIDVAYHETPTDADRRGCDWPEAFAFTVGEDWTSGYYDLELVAPEGESSHHFLCVRRAPSTPPAKAVVVLNTNTYFAYNYWGGANAYAHVERLQAGELDPEAARDLALGELSRMRPFAQGMFAPPPQAPRLINRTPRGMDEFALPGDPDWMRRHRPSVYDGSAGFLQKWEHRFAEWAERAGYALDYLTDHDFERDASVLDGYTAVLLVGHSEYWSAKGRSQLRDFVDSGGRLAVFSGNTSYWKVRWEDEGRTLVAHKWRGETHDPLWRDPATRADATHLWSHPAFGAPEAELFGLSFLYGGYHRLGMCVARGSAAFTVYDDAHWALAGTDLYYGDQLGWDVPLIGYENDGCPIRFGPDGLPRPDGGVGVPQDLRILALAPATLAESARSPYPPIIPPEQPDVLARIAFGSDTPETIERLMRGHAVMASFELGEGEVFNAGTTEWAHGLAARNPFVERITRNVLARFGVEPG